MQNNGFKIFATVAFLALCGYYLYPTVQNYFLSQRLESLEGEERAAYVAENAGYIQEVRGRSLNLGLDLLGGMHVTLEVQVASLLGELADGRDEAFNEVLQAARVRSAETGESAVDAFVDEFETRDAEARLSRYFRDQQATITRASSNDEVAAYLGAEVDEAVDRAIEIVRNRVNRFGVTEPSIQRVGGQRITVALPGIDDPERIRDLLRGTARLEFRLMADPEQLARAAQRIVQYYEPSAADSAEAAAQAADTTAAQDAPAQDTVTQDGAAEGGEGGDVLTATGDTAGQALGTAPVPGEGGAANPLLQIMQPLPYNQPGAPPSVVFAQVVGRDTARANELLNRPEVRELLPPNAELMYGANPIGATQDGAEVFNLLAVREEVEMTGDVVTDASVGFDQRTNQPRVSMDMDSEGARIWARVTTANVDRQVAIALDGVIYSNPVIEEPITGGSTSITGLESRTEAQDIVNVLKSGALPAPVEIIGERTVGPSLGEASIQAGLTSVLVGLLLVALFMIVYYRTGGVVADIALLVNLIFLLGILAAFGATLTLPGIAGIVLTIGMAVDANVLIFERIREELDAGKTLRAAIDAGYANALSAIMDGQITTFFVGVILFSFGVGPIKGFAVTLMAGILTSLFTSIIVTRVLFDYMVEERGMEVQYG